MTHVSAFGIKHPHLRGGVAFAGQRVGWDRGFDPGEILLRQLGRDRGQRLVEARALARPHKRQDVRALR